MFGVNPYSPYGYPFQTPQMAQQQAFSPTVMPGITTPTNPSVTPPNSPPAVMQVATAKDFDSVTIQPGRQALIMAQNDPYIAFKSADAMGMVQTSLYRIEPVTMEQINGPSPEYVTRQEFQQTIQQLIDGLNKPAPVPAAAPAPTPTPSTGRQSRREAAAE